MRSQDRCSKEEDCVRSAQLYPMLSTGEEISLSQSVQKEPSNSYGEGICAPADRLYSWLKITTIPFNIPVSKVVITASHYTRWCTNIVVGFTEANIIMLWWSFVGFKVHRDAVSMDRWWQLMTETTIGTTWSIAWGSCHLQCLKAPVVNPMF